MDTTRCDCCDLPVIMCGKAAQQRLERQEREFHAQLLRTPPWFAATYAGICAGCGERFAVGWPIRSSGQHYGKRSTWISACCAEKVA